jgi:tRNA(Ile)-lysidine synthase TilS/MesJ
VFELVDRLGNRELIVPLPGDRVETILLRHHVPPSSVLVMRDGQPVSDSHLLEDQAGYTAHLIEGYDLRTIRAVLSRLQSDPDAAAAAYAVRRIGFSTAGELETESVGLSLEETAAYVEQKIADTCREFELIREGDRVVIGLSGGVDSSSLLLALDAVRPHLPSFRLIAATFEDFDREHSRTFEHAVDLAGRLGVEHHVVPAQIAQEVFRLRLPLREILPGLMRTSSAHHVMYVDHHTTRRALEVFAERSSFNRIALGLHVTDLLAGLLNGWATGYHVGSLPVRPIGDVEYVYPLAFVTKRELHLYHLHRTGELARHSFPNPWEINPKDRNFYYYLADLMQSYWPGLETMLIPAHNWRVRREPPLRYEECENCGSTLLHQPFSSISSAECDACTLLRSAGYLAETA